jgi:hypothetical protein
MIEIDSILLGDNQFFGVNHMSHDKGQKTYQKFKDINEIKKIFYAAMDNGVTGCFFSTHPAIYQITDMVRKDPALKKTLSFYVNVPYVLKYSQMLNEMGALNTIKTILGGHSFMGKVAYMAKAGVNLMTRNYLAITNRLVDAEMSPFNGLNVKSIFLHNALVDLALGYDMVNVLKNFHDYVSKHYGVVPGFGTLNYPLFADLLERAGIDEALVMCAINKKGFLMNPSREATEKSIQNTKHTVLAMATLASGRIKPDEAYEYLFSLGRVKNVVVGLSSTKHANETFGLLNSYLKNREVI